MVAGLVICGMGSAGFDNGMNVGGSIYSDKQIFSQGNPGLKVLLKWERMAEVQLWVGATAEIKSAGLDTLSLEISSSQPSGNCVDTHAHVLQV